MKQWELRGVTVDVNGGAITPPTPAQATVSIRILWDQIPAILWTTDADLVLTSSLGSRLARLGLGANQLAGTPLTVLFGADDGPVQAHRRALGGESVTFETTWTEVSYRAEVGPLRDSIGQVIGTICVALGESAEDPRDWGNHPQGYRASDIR